MMPRSHDGATLSHARAKLLALEASRDRARFGSLVAGEVDAPLALALLVEEQCGDKDAVATVAARTVGLVESTGASLPAEDVAAGDEDEDEPEDRAASRAARDNANFASTWVVSKSKLKASTLWVRPER